MGISGINCSQMYSNLYRIKRRYIFSHFAAIVCVCVWPAQLRRSEESGATEYEVALNQQNDIKRKIRETLPANFSFEIHYATLSLILFQTAFFRLIPNGLSGIIFGSTHTHVDIFRRQQDVV